MNVNDRYQVVSEDGLIATTRTRAEAFRIGARHANEAGNAVEVFDCMAHIGAPESWHYDSAGWAVIDIRKTQ